MKPFIYALALDEGLVTPRTVIPDIPVHFAGYHPENYDRECRGPVTVREALVESLNLPVLGLTARLGLEHVAARICQAGITTLDRRADHYGLSLALGTCETTLLDLANAYACLARGGVQRPVAWLAREAPVEGRRVFSAEAAWLVADMLAGEERAVAGHRADARLPRVAWKTGTSAGNRDAWCLAFNPEFVVGVWIGNPDGRPAAALVGVTAAAPVAHDLFRRLYPGGAAPWFPRPPGLARRAVCALSGQLPGPRCPVTVADEYLPDISSCAACAVHAPPDAGGAAAGVEAWPAAVQAFLRTSGRGAEVQAAGAPGVRIAAPNAGAVYRLATDTPAWQQALVLRVQPGPDPADLFWFVDGRLQTADRPGGEVVWPLARGRHLITCCDRQGRGDSAAITVE